MSEASRPARPNNRLEAESVLGTLENLERRIRERFPTRTLGDTCREMAETARRTSARVERAYRPYVLLRLASAAVVAVVGAGFLFLGWKLGPLVAAMMMAEGGADPTVATQVLESAVNLGLLAAVSIWSLVSLETRLRRRRVLGYLHELRRFAHVIDMHQLSKDPVSILHPQGRTPSSPVRDMTEFELARYLDYCAEMLALTGKLAALYSEDADDTEIVEASNDIETLTTNLGRKVWQKIALLGAARGPKIG